MGISFRDLTKMSETYNKQEQLTKNKNKRNLKSNKLQDDKLLIINKELNNTILDLKYELKKIYDLNKYIWDYTNKLKERLFSKKNNEDNNFIIDNLIKIIETFVNNKSNIIKKNGVINNTLLDIKNYLTNNNKKIENMKFKIKDNMKLKNQKLSYDRNCFKNNFEDEIIFENKNIYDKIKELKNSKSKPIESNIESNNSSYEEINYIKPKFKNNIKKKKLLSKSNLKRNNN